MATTTASTAPLTAEASADAAAVAALLDGLDITVVEAGPATASRKCSTDNGCDTVAGSDC
ncbi:FxLD family lanthipeptide [Actinoallomurus sp. CA-150999]|uniref:FxLD family lanthipeptide n=1 Tax=Actinoallomurus sp. CA-150999 TaxID=3239887 RepID=UPI003D906592